MMLCQSIQMSDMPWNWPIFPLQVLKHIYYTLCLNWPFVYHFQTPNCSSIAKPLNILDVFTSLDNWFKNKQNTVYKCSVHKEEPYYKQSNRGKQKILHIIKSLVHRLQASFLNFTGKTKSTYKVMYMQSWCLNLFKQKTLWRKAWP